MTCKHSESEIEWNSNDDNFQYQDESMLHIELDFIFHDKRNK